jgi:hypothetical protein
MKKREKVSEEIEAKQIPATSISKYQNRVET